MKEQVESLEEKALAESFQEHIHRNAKQTNGTPIKIQSIRKLTKHTLKIHCHEEKDAKALQNLKRGTLEGTAVLKPTYRVVAHGVSKSAINPETQSRDDIKVERVMALMRRARNPGAPTQSIMVFTESPKDADNLISKRAPDRQEILPCTKVRPTLLGGTNASTAVDSGTRLASAPG